MMLTRCLLQSVLFLAVFVGTPLASTIYVGTINANDKIEYVQSLVDEYNSERSGDDLIPDDLTLLGKYDDISWDWSWDWSRWELYKDYTGKWIDAEDEEWESPYFEVHFTSNSGSEGFLAETSQEFDQAFYFSVKSGNQFALYYVEDDIWSCWQTFSGQELSHISFWAVTTPSDTADPVPEPATLVLLGMGILGLARTGRKYFPRS